MGNTSLLAQCESYLLGLGFLREDRGDYCSFDWCNKERDTKMNIGFSGNGQDRQLYVQADMRGLGKRGAIKYRKRLLFGWAIDTVDDLKLIFKKQAQLSYISEL